MAVKRFSTGNEYVALPDVVRSDCGVHSISFVHMLYRSAVELCGTDGEPFLVPFIGFGGEMVDLSRAEWRLEHYWIPTFSVEDDRIKVFSRIYAPLGHRGFIWSIEIESKSKERQSVEVGWKGCWRDTYHCASVSKQMRGERFGSLSARYAGVPVVEFKGAAPLFAVAFFPSERMEVEIESEAEPSRKIKDVADGQTAASDGQAIRYLMRRDIVLNRGEKASLYLCVGLGLEEVSAVTSAADFMGHGTEALYTQLSSWLASHRLTSGEDALERVLDVNSFYGYFYSQALAIDTEELVVLTARSRRHGVTAAYSDYEAMLWSFPAILQIDPAQARRVLEYAFRRQIGNVGVRTRFVDGVVLEPGFSLGCLCAPIRALAMYVRATRDISISYDRGVQAGVNKIMQILMSRKHHDTALFSTMLLPNGELAPYPYITFDNVLVWRCLNDLSWMYELIRDLDRSEENKSLADQVKKAVMEHCVVEGSFGRMFAYGVDLNGSYQLGDCKQSSLELLSWFGFCEADDPVYKNTLEWIRSLESDRSEGLSVVSIVNGLLSDRKEESIRLLEGAGLDDGIACESVDGETGEVIEGHAYATCAGYLAYALGSALGAKLMGPEPEPSDRLYQPPPPEIRDRLQPEVK
jgi:hypothetical protein